LGLYPGGDNADDKGVKHLKQHNEKRRLSRSMWAAAILLAAALVAGGATQVVAALGAALIVQEGTALLVFLLITVVAVAWMDRKAVAEAPTVGAEISTVATVIGLAVLVLGGLRLAGAISTPPAVGCINSAGPDRATVSLDQAVTYSKPTANSTATGLLVVGCRVQFDGFCVGDSVPDQIARIPDARWLKLSGRQGYLPAGQTAGPPPSADEPRADCPVPRRRPAVTSASGRLNIRRGTVKLLTRARDTPLIGFAVQEGAVWRRIGWNLKPAKDGAVTLSVSPASRPVLVVRAVPCVGYHQPVGGTKTFSVRSGAAGPAADPFNAHQPVSRDSGDAACDLPVIRPAR
jgi:hypothetical protein